MRKRPSVGALSVSRVLGRRDKDIHQNGAAHFFAKLEETSRLNWWVSRKSPLTTKLLDLDTTLYNESLGATSSAEVYRGAVKVVAAAD